jgi:dTDP-4-amino-4,6-dideoxygalactose transaminase
MENVTHNYSYFPVLIDPELFLMNKDDLHKKLEQYNIFTRKYFYPLVNDTACYSGKYDNVTSVAIKVASRILTLPIYATLKLSDVDRVCEIIRIIAEISENVCLEGS